MNLDRLIALLIHGERVPNAVLLDLLVFVRARLLQWEQEGFWYEQGAHTLCGHAKNTLDALDEMARNYLDAPPPTGAKRVMNVKRF